MRSCSWIVGFVMLLAVYVTAASEMALDGSVSYWTPTFFDTTYSIPAIPQLLARSDRIIAAQQVKLERGVCYDLTYRMNETIYDYDQDEVVPNPRYSLLYNTIQNKEGLDIDTKDDIWRALRGNRYTEYLQLGYTIENGKSSIYGPGSWTECKFGCFPNVVYHGEAYTNVCVRDICKEGRTPNTLNFCDASVGNHVYLHYTSFWCESIPQPVVLCGAGGHCAQKPNGDFFCDGDPASSASGYSSSSVEYVLIAPMNSSEPIMVAAYKNGKLLTKKPISNLGGAAYVARYGPVDSSQAQTFAASNGLAELVESILGNPFAVNRLAQFR